METSLAMWISIAVAMMFIAVWLLIRLQTVSKKRAEDHEAFVLRLKAEVLHNEAEKNANGQLLLEDIAPVLTAINLSVNSLEIHSEDEPILQKVNVYIERLMKLSQHTTRQLHSRLFFRKNLQQVLLEYASHATSIRNSRKITVTGHTFPNLPIDLASNMFRIFDTVSKLFKSKDINLHAQQMPTECLVSITIHGFQATDEKFLQDPLFRNRVELLNGYYTITQSNEQPEARLILVLPVQEHEHFSTQNRLQEKN